jgi:hypothetical protein
MERGPQPHGRTTDGQRLEYTAQRRWDRLQQRAYNTTEVSEMRRLPDDPRRLVQELAGEGEQLSEALAPG